MSGTGWLDLTGVVTLPSGIRVRGDHRRAVETSWPRRWLRQVG
jgi:hypothetical protein